MKYFRVFFAILNTCLIKIFYQKKIKVNIFKSYIDGVVNLNKGCLIIGDGFRSRPGSSFNVTSGSVDIGKNVFFNRNVSINCHEQISIGENTIFGENILIYDHDHKFDNLTLLKKEQGFVHSPILIGANVWIGAGCIILKGCSIGDNSVIAAGSIVTIDVPSDSIFIQKREKTIIKL